MLTGTLIVGVAGNDLVHGGDDRDLVFGLGGNDTLFGGDNASYTTDKLIAGGNEPATRIGNEARRQAANDDQFAEAA